MDIKKFLDIEKKYSLYNLEIDGINVWEYSRFEIWNYVLCAEKLALQEAHRKRKNMGIVKIAGNVLKSYLRYLFSKHRNVDVCFITHERRVKESEYYECIYSEGIINKYANSIVLEKPHDYGHLTPTKTPNMYYTDWIIVVGNVYAKINSILKTSIYKSVCQRIEDKLRPAYNEIKEYYQIETGLDKFVKMNVDRYFMCKSQYKMYEKLLHKFSPKVIVEVCHYNRQCMLINEIARKMNVSTLELQHGTMHSQHAAYQYNSETELAQLPTKILLFSDYWKSEINMPLSDVQLIATGFPYFEEKVAEYKEKKVSCEKVTILFISQGTIGKELSALAVNLLQKLDLTKYRIIYKLHPGEYNDWEERYEWLAKSDIEVIANSGKGIYEYFAISDIQVGVYSTAMYEGLGFGLKTIIYNVGHADTMQKLVEQGYATLVHNVDELVSDINSNTQNSGQNVFWKENAFENIKKVIDTELARKDV